MKKLIIFFFFMSCLYCYAVYAEQGVAAIQRVNVLQANSERVEKVSCVLQIVDDIARQTTFNLVASYQDDLHQVVYMTTATVRSQLKPFTYFIDNGAKRKNDSIGNFKLENAAILDELKQGNLLDVTIHDNRVHWFAKNLNHHRQAINSFELCIAQNFARPI